VSSLDGLLASYLDLARHLDPLRHPDEAPAEVHRRLGRFDAAWRRARVAALRSIAHAIEDLEDVEALADEVDRTMLLDTVRAEMVRLEDAADGPTADPGTGLRHAVAALDALLGEAFDAEREAALRDRLAELPGFLAALREEERPAPAFLVTAASSALAALADRLELAAEWTEEGAVEAARTAVAIHHDWLADAARVGGVPGVGEEATEARLATLSPEPLGVKGTLRTLEFRRAGIERSLAAIAGELGYADWRAAVRAVVEEAPLELMEREEAWTEEWQRVGTALEALGLPVVNGPVPPVPSTASGWALAGQAVRGHAVAMLDAVRAVDSRPVRRLLQAPGLARGWGRTVAALVRDTEALGTPERRLLSVHAALVEAIGAETDLLFAARRQLPSSLAVRATELGGLPAGEAEALVAGVTATPFEALAAGLAHEGWQVWYAEEGGDPIAFAARALRGGGLSVPVARWAVSV
jgi:hypothetical protein